MFMPYFLYPFIHQLTLGLCLPIDYCEQCCYEHSTDPVFNSLGYIAVHDHFGDLVAILEMLLAFHDSFFSPSFKFIVFNFFYLFVMITVDFFSINKHMIKLVVILKYQKKCDYLFSKKEIIQNLSHILLFCVFIHLMINPLRNFGSSILILLV